MPKQVSIGLTLCTLWLALWSGTALANQPPSPEPFPPLAATGKLDALTLAKLQEKLRQRETVRVLIKLQSADESAAALEPRQARTEKARAARARSITRLQGAVLRRLGLSRVPAAKQLKHIPYLALEVDEAELERLAQLPEVVRVFEDTLLRPTLDVSVPQIGADNPALDGVRGDGQVIAVLDTGIDPGHGAFAGRIIAEACFSTTSTSDNASTLCPNGSNEQIGAGAAQSCSGILGCDHGTHVAGIAASAAPLYTGVAPGADLIAVQVFSRLDDLFDCGFLPPCLSAYTSDVIRGLEWIYEQRDSLEIAAVNMSLGGEFYTTQAECDAAYPGVKLAIDNLRAAGIATVVASGNDGVAGAISTPACVSSAISVGAVDGADNIADFANTAPFLSLLTPGVDIVSSVPGGGFASKSGTSMASPHGAGAVAVLSSVDPDATVDEVLAAMTDSGVPIYDPIGGYTLPRVQVDAAADALLPELGDVTLALEPVIAGLDQPIAIAHAGDGSGRLFIGLQRGKVLIHDGTVVLPTPFLDVPVAPEPPGSPGLLGIAFHPEYASNGLFYVSYVDVAGAITVARYATSANPDRAEPGSATVILGPLGADDHHGGQLQFGPDGYLYIALGDGAPDGATASPAGDPTSLLGKMLRIDVDGASPYSIPIDNPFAGSASPSPSAREEIWALGLRDPWRFSFDRLTGDLYVADIGEAYEEINVARVDSAGGEDYGWSLMEGNECYGDPNQCAGLTLPVAGYDHGEGCAITGGHVYRGQDERDMRGVYFSGDFCSGRIWGLLYDGIDSQYAPLLETPYEISTFGEDEAGNVYVADRDGGTVYRLSDSDLAIDTASLPSGVIGTGYSVAFTANGGALPYAWSVTGGVLPAGLSLDGVSGLLSGVPSALGTSTFTVQLQDAHLATLTRELSLTITTSPPVIETTSLPDGNFNGSYHETLAVSEGLAPYTWSIAWGALPPGLGLDAALGVIAGTPSTPGTYAFAITVTDVQGLSHTQPLEIVIKAEISLTVGVTDTGQYGHLYGTNQHREELVATFIGSGDDLVLSVDGYDIDYNTEVAVSLNGVFLGHLSKGANDGLNAGNTFAILSAEQLAPGQENRISFKQVYKVGFRWGVTNLLLAVPSGPPDIQTTTLPDAQANESYSATLTAIGGLQPYTWSVASGSLPPGLTLSPDGTIAGSATAGGTYQFDVQVSDALNALDVQSLSVLVNSLNVVLTVGTMDTGQYGHLYGSNQHLEELIATFTGTSSDLILSVTGFDIDYNTEVLVSLNGNPLGHLTKGANDGLNAGDTFSVPAAAQLFEQDNVISFKQVYSVGFKWGVTNLLLELGQAPDIQTTSLPDATSGQSYSETLTATQGTPPYSWSVASGSLPPGLTLSAGGVISGTPSGEGAFGFDVRVTDSLGPSDTQTLSIQLNRDEVVLEVGITETGKYGNSYGTSQHRNGLPVTFIGTGTNLVLSVQGYDIDYNNEVRVLLNGVLLGYLSKGPNNRLNAGDAFPIPASQQLEGPNELRFEQARNLRWRWGVTNLRLDFSS